MARDLRLTDRTIKAAQAREKAYKLTDGGGLYLEVTPAGGKCWRFKYRYRGKENRLALGRYPDVPLAVARDLHLEARRQLAAGIDPNAARREKREAELAAARSFEDVTREWLGRRAGRKDERSETLNTRRFENHVFPLIGKARIDEVKAPDLRRVLLRIEDTGKGELAHRVRTLLGQVLRYSQSMGYREDDVTNSMRGLLQPVTVKHHAAITEPKTFGGLLRALYSYGGEPHVNGALRLAPLVFVRPGELVRMRWADVDLKAKQWRFVTSKTKTDLIVPLAPQSIAVLEEVRAFTGGQELVFHSVRSKSRRMSENTLNAAIAYCGFDTSTTHCAHGFRASARTMLEEQLGFPVAAIELQLGHAVKGPLGESYSRAKYLDTRTEMMVAWGEYLDELRAGVDDGEASR